MQHKNHPLDLIIMGPHPVEAICSYAPHRLLQVYISQSSQDLQPRKKQLLKKIEALNIPQKKVSKDHLDKICHSTSHQGVAALLKPRDHVNLETLFNQDGAFVLALDEINDPHNLGAILRACECFKIDLVMWSKNRGASITPTVTKTSASASELVPIKIISNLSTTLEKFSNEGFKILGAQITAESENVFDFKFPKKTVLVLGSEGKGLRPITQKRCDGSLMIPMFGQIDSLNVSQAAAVFLSQWKASQLNC